MYHAYLLILALTLSACFPVPAEVTPPMWSPLAAATMAENLPNINDQPHTNIIQNGSGSISTISQRIPWDPAVDGVYMPASPFDMLAYPHAGLFSSVRAVITAFATCYPTYIIRTAAYFMGDTGHPSPHAPSKTVEGMHAWYSRVFANISNHQSPNPPPPPTGIAPHHSIEHLMRYSQYSAIAYCTRDAAIGMSNVSIPSVPGGTLLVGSFDIHEWYEVDDLLYYVAVNHAQRSIILGFRGSDSIENMLRDLNFQSMRPDPRLFPGFPPSGYVHRGFQLGIIELFSPQRPGTNIIKVITHHVRNNPDYGLIITGHSMGGSFAVLVALSLRLRIFPIAPNIRVYTYGQPIVSNGIFSDWMADVIGHDNYIRAVSSNDLVPYVGFNGYDTTQAAINVFRHPAYINEIYAPLWREPIIQTCNGYADNLCSENMNCISRVWNHHSWFGGARMGDEFCLLSHVPLLRWRLSKPSAPSAAISVGDVLSQ